MFVHMWRVLHANEDDLRGYTLNGFPHALNIYIYLFYSILFVAYL